MWRLSSLKIRVYTASRRSSDTQLIYWQNRNLLSLSVFECCSDVDISQGNNLRSIFIMRLADSLYIPTSATSFLTLTDKFSWIPSFKMTMFSSNLTCFKHPEWLLFRLCMAPFALHLISRLYSLANATFN